MPAVTPELNFLIDAWAQFAQGTATLALRPVVQDVDSELLARLSEAERQRGQSFTSALRRMEWAEGRRCELEVRGRLLAKSKVNPDFIRTSVTHGRDGEQGG